MTEKRQQRWIIRYEGRIVYYPWSWMSFGALSAYVVDSPKVVRTALRRRRRALLLAGLWAAASYLFWMRLSVAMLAIDAMVLYAVRRWELRGLADHAVRLPSRLSAGLVVDRQGELDEQLSQSLIGSMTVAIMLISFQPWQLNGDSVVLWGLTLVFSTANTVLLLYLQVLKRRSGSYNEMSLIEEAQSRDRQIQTTP